MGGALVVALLAAALGTAALRPTCADFFFHPECPHCQAVMPHIAELQKQYSPNLTVNRHDVRDADNRDALVRLFEMRHWQDAKGVPTVFVGGATVMGEDVIKRSLESAVLAQQGASCVDLSSLVNRTSSVAQTVLTVSGALSVALLGALHPGSLTVFLVLLRFALPRDDGVAMGDSADAPGGSLEGGPGTRAPKGDVSKVPLMSESATEIAEDIPDGAFSKAASPARRAGGPRCMSASLPLAILVVFVWEFVLSFSLAFVVRTLFSTKLYLSLAYIAPYCGLFGMSAIRPFMIDTAIERLTQRSRWIRILLGLLFGLVGVLVIVLTYKW
eukprot:m51a1_g6625 hypothetical protein (329) ;mRNA; f:56235-57597